MPTAFKVIGVIFSLNYSDTPICILFPLSSNYILVKLSIPQIQKIPENSQTARKSLCKPNCFKYPYINQIVPKSFYQPNCSKVHILTKLLRYPQPKNVNNCANFFKTNFYLFDSAYIIRNTVF